MLTPGLLQSRPSGPTGNSEIGVLCPRELTYVVIHLTPFVGVSGSACNMGEACKEPLVKVLSESVCDLLLHNALACGGPGSGSLSRWAGQEPLLLLRGRDLSQWLHQESVALRRLPLSSSPHLHRYDDLTGCSASTLYLGFSSSSPRVIAIAKGILLSTCTPPIAVCFCPSEQFAPGDSPSHGSVERAEWRGIWG
jgi:hypothetical protein